MKPLGIVLLFLNLLAAAGVAYLATKSWGNKHEQNVSIEKIELTLAGVPTTATGAATIPTNPEDTVKLYNRDVRAKVLTDYFGQVTRVGDFDKMSVTPPLSVVAEVEDMKKQIEALLAVKANSVAKIEYLVGTPKKAGFLTLLADDFEERAAFREWLAEAQQPKNPNAFTVDELLGFARAALDAKFALATGKPDVAKCDDYEKVKREARAARDTAFDQYQRAPKAAGQDAKFQTYLDALKAYWKALSATSSPLSEADRRRRAAGLLAVLDTSAVGQKRTALLVGLNDYANAVLDRTQRLSSMPERYDRQGESELASFGLIYKQKLKTSQNLDFMLQRQLDITRTFAAQEKAASDQVITRTKHRDDAQGRVDDLDKKVKAAAVAQAELEKEIFSLQQLAGRRFDELFLLEEQVLQAEKQKSGK